MKTTIVFVAALFAALLSGCATASMIVPVRVQSSATNATDERPAELMMQSKAPASRVFGRWAGGFLVLPEGKTVAGVCAAAIEQKAPGCSVRVKSFWVTDRIAAAGFATGIDGVAEVEISRNGKSTTLSVKSDSLKFIGGASAFSDAAQELCKKLGESTGRAISAGAL